MIDFNDEQHKKNRLSRLVERLMQSEMNAINSYQEALDELSYTCDSSDGQLCTDVKALIEDIRTKLSGDETAHLRLLSQWQVHFGEINVDEIEANISDVESGEDKDVSSD